MKTFFTKLKQHGQTGFTLVELMVVVAIIGVLSAVAIPNFKKYQAKAKVSEAKLQLSSIYTAQTSFYADFNIYHNCLKYMGYDPTPEISSRYYTTGIIVAAAVPSAAWDSAVNSGLSAITGTVDGCGTATEAALAGKSMFIAGKVVTGAVAPTTEIASAATGGTTLATDVAFRAGAAGYIMSGFTSAGTSSYLTVDHVKVFSNVRNGY